MLLKQGRVSMSQQGVWRVADLASRVYAHGFCLVAVCFGEVNTLSETHGCLVAWGFDQAHGFCLFPSQEGGKTDTESHSCNWITGVHSYGQRILFGVKHLSNRKYYGGCR